MTLSWPCLSRRQLTSSWLFLVSLDTVCGFYGVHSPVYACRGFLYGLRAANPFLEEIWSPRLRQARTRRHACASMFASLSARVPLCACMHKPGPGSPSPSPLGALKNEGGNLRAAVIIHPSKQMGRRQRRSWERGGREGGRDVGRKKERAKWERWRGDGGDILTHISLYLAFCIQDGLAHISIFLSVCLSGKL